MKHLAACLLGGIGFGFVLGWTRLTDPDTIHDMLRLRETYVFLIMGSAIATGALGVRLLRRFGVRTLADHQPVSWKALPANRDHVVGAFLFGLGWSVANTCPGPTAAMIGRGQWAGLFTALGLFCGVAWRDAIKARAARGAVSGLAPSQATPASSPSTIGL